MRKSTSRMMTAGIFGICIGAVLLFAVMFAIGRYTDAPAADDASTPTPEASSAPTPVSSASADPRRVESATGKYVFTLPSGYRVATLLTKRDTEVAPAAAAPITITKATEEQERQYLDLIRTLTNAPGGTELPSFTPGKTITVFVATDPYGETSDAQLASGKASLTTSVGHSAMRYSRVNGLYTYDATYISRPSGAKVVVMMTYPSSNDGAFDEQAYKAVIDTIGLLP